MVLAASMTLPAFVAASHKSSSRVPACSALSRGAIANLVGTGRLTLKKKIGNYCAFTGVRYGHYKGDVSLSHVIYLVKDILSGKIH